jgi:short-subunit dehydrogenase
MNIVITGAGQGIGRSLALRFSNIERTKLFLISRTENKLSNVLVECREINSATNVKIIPYDITGTLYEPLPASLDCEHIDILINNAGGLIKKEFASLTTNDMTDMITTNFLAPAMLISRLTDRLGGKTPSHVVNIGSMAGFQGSRKFPGLSVYSASKAALAALTECLAVEYESKNIFINCLALGSVQTEMLAKAFPTLKAPLVPEQIADYITDFAINGFRYFNGKVLPVSLITP